jgi:6,7-dimethyl-8-ribityllumazine synthase
VQKLQQGKESAMGKVFEGQISGRGLRIAIVVSRFNDFITGNLLDGARDALIRNGVLEKDIDIAWVPGSFEMPFAAHRLQSSKRYKAILCLGAIIRGATPHFEYLAAEVTKGLAQVALDGPAPVINGVIMADTVDQAVERARAKVGNKGFSAALNAIEMADLASRLSGK